MSTTPGGPALSGFTRDGSSGSSPACAAGPGPDVLPARR